MSRNAVRSLVTTIAAVSLLLTPSIIAQSTPVVTATEPARSAGELLERALSSRVNLSFGELTLGELAARLRHEFHINVIVDKKGLDDVGLDDDTRLHAVECKDVMLESALELYLDQVELYFFVRDGVLVLTTPEEAENHVETVVYPVVDLLTTIPANAYGQHPESADYDSLIEVITSTVEPDTWDEVGGAGSIEPYPASGALVLSQVRKVHRQVQKLLEDLRQSRAVQHLSNNVVTPGVDRSEAVSTARQPRESSTLQPPPRYVYQPNAAWVLPRKHD